MQASVRESERGLSGLMTAVIGGLGLVVVLATAGVWFTSRGVPCRLIEAQRLAILGQLAGIVAHQVRIFGPFFTTKASGLGLGVPLSRRVAAPNGGTLEFKPGDPRGVAIVLRLQTRDQGGRSP